MTCFLNGASNELREFGGTTREILKIADWLMENKCEMIVMESPASYWKSLYNIFESVAWIIESKLYSRLEPEKVKRIGILQKKPGAGKEPGVELTAKNAGR